jgi:uncharacterized membrane protein
VATLTVWRFPSPHGAEEAVYTLEQLQKQELIKVHDAALVRWDIGAKRPRTRELNNLNTSAAGGALGGAFWGLLFGLVFFVPLLGLAVGAAMGALTGSLTDVGINDDFIKSIRDKVTPGTSALFVLTSDAVVDRVASAFAGQDMELISTNLSNDQEAALHDAFAQ